MKLTPKQKAFVEHYAANGGNGTQAAIAAGYSEKTAYSTASENMNKPEIIEYLATLTQSTTDNRIASATERQEFLSDVMRGAIDDTKLTDRLKACEVLGKMQGDFVDKVHLSGGVVQMPVVIEVVGV